MAVVSDARAVAVVGGGWAGMTTAVTLAAAGIPVTVFESAQVLGGRARGVSRNGSMLDNGQHLLLGAYRDTLALIHRVQPDVAPHSLYLRIPLDITGPGRFRLRSRRLPAPLHSLIGLLAAQDCSWAERLAVISAFIGWRRDGWRCAAEMTVHRLLRGQPAAITARLWIPLCLAALNTPPAQASAQIFLNVVRDVLAGGRTDSDMIFPIADLAQLFPAPAARFVAARGGTVLRGAMIRTMTPTAGGVMLGLQGGQRSFRRVVVATAPCQAARLLQQVPEAARVCSLIGAYTYQPITTVYLAYPARVRLPAPMVQLAGSPGQWVFERPAPPAGGSLLAVVISADGPHRLLGHDALADAVRQQLVQTLQGVGALHAPDWTQVITERRATHTSSPNRLPPAAAQVARGLFLAGDHTDPDYPATLEAAVRSGLRAATAILGEQ
ncbi:MAG: hydroxysqualene dehydroxylase HpnE [Betaproteobacteria bacterium]